MYTEAGKFMSTQQLRSCPNGLTMLLARHHCRTFAANYGVDRSQKWLLDCRRDRKAVWKAVAKPGDYLTDLDLRYLQEAATLAGSSAGLTPPHPNAACILLDPQGQKLASAHLRAQGTPSPELQAVTAAGPRARGATAYLNLETGDCHGDATAIEALVHGGVSRVVVGLQHPLAHCRGRAVEALRGSGVVVDVLGCTVQPSPSPEAERATLAACLAANDALLHRAVLRRPLSVLKYAMTLDGKIATNTGHSYWVSSSFSRAKVFEARARSDAVIVGGNTVRRDNPQLTTRREGGHTPLRVVVSRTMDLPESAQLWDVSVAPTTVVTQRGTRPDLQARLRGLGVEVVEVEDVHPGAVAKYCYERGFLQLFWECGGSLAAPCISHHVIHRVMAFVAPKIIGGQGAPSPVGELGFEKMTQALEMWEPAWQQVGPDMLFTGYLPNSRGPAALEASLPGSSNRLLGHLQQPVVDATADGSSNSSGSSSCAAASAASSYASSASHSISSSSGSSSGRGSSSGTGTPAASSQPSSQATFYKAWDKWGALSSFSAHAVSLPDPVAGPGALREWRTVQHYYQAMRFAGPSAASGAPLSPEARQVIEAIAGAESPEEAARIGWRVQREQPHLVRSDWATARLDVMHAALRAKFLAHAGPRALLLSSIGLDLVDGSPHDTFWGKGHDNSGQNHMGRLLMRIRSEHLTS